MIPNFHAFIFFDKFKFVRINDHASNIEKYEIHCDLCGSTPS
jgi:alpha-D-ribose 1-methylphosphonate 5-phosphate C-P lyase